MKRASLGSIFLYEGDLVEVFAVSDGDRVLVVKPIGKDPCPTCGHDHRMGLIESSPGFQDKVKPVKTLEES